MSPRQIVVVNQEAPVVQRYTVQTIHGGVEDLIFPDWPWTGGDSIEDAASAYEGSWFRRATAFIFATYTGDGTPPDPSKPPAQDWTDGGTSDHLSIRLRAAVLPGLTGYIDTRERPRANISWELADGVAFVPDEWQLWILPFSVILAASPTADLTNVQEIGFGPDTFDLDDFRVGFTRNVPILGVKSSVRAR